MKVTTIELIDYWLLLEKETHCGSGYYIESFFDTIVDLLPIDDIEKAMRIAHSKRRENYFKYFMKICWNWVKEDQQKGIIKERLCSR